MEKIILTTFTDPMMGLSYECEPVYEKLASCYGEQLEFRYVMAGLVRDVSDFMLPDERVLPAEEGIRKYNGRLAEIYKEEESIGGLPMNMEGFHLFGPEHRSSYPICVAFKAAQLTDPVKSEAYLYRLRRAIIVESRPATHREELVSIAKETGLNPKKFCACLDDGSAEKAFREDLQLTRRLGVHQLPQCLIRYKDQAVMVNGVIGYDGFVSVISRLLQSI